MKRFLTTILLVLMSVFLLCGCSGEAPYDQRTVLLYFTNSSHDGLVYETSNISKAEYMNVEGLVGLVLDELFAGPSGTECFSVIPKGMSVRGVSISSSENGTVNVDLSGDFYNSLKKSRYASDELLARYSIICTLCQFDEIKKVKLYINREDLRNNYGEGDIVAPMGSESVLMNSPSSVETQTEKFVTLYFTDKDRKKLYPETRKATMTDNSIEKTIVNELIRGPVSDDLERTIDPDTELVSVETAEGICFVNFASGFMSNIQSGSDEEKTALYSIVNSLTRLDSIEKVQVLIDGKKPENDAHQLFSNPIERNVYIIEENEK